MLLHLGLGSASASGNNKDILLVVGFNYNIYHFAWADQRLLQGNISYIALLRGQYLDIALAAGQYLDIAREGGFQSSFHPPFDPTFDLKVVQYNTPVIYIVDLITFTCGIEFTIF